MALNPIVFTEKVVRSFLRYQLTAYPVRRRTPARADAAAALARRDAARRRCCRGRTSAFRGRSGRGGGRLTSSTRACFTRTCASGSPARSPTSTATRKRRSAPSTPARRRSSPPGPGSGKTECFLYPIVSKCLELRTRRRTSGISAVIVYPMNALAEDQLGRLRSLLAGTGIPFGMYVGKTPEHETEVAGIRLPAGLFARRLRGAAGAGARRETQRDGAPAGGGLLARGDAHAGPPAADPAHQREAARAAADAPTRRRAVRRRAARLPGLRRSAHLHRRAGRRNRLPDPPPADLLRSRRRRHGLRRDLGDHCRHGQPGCGARLRRRFFGVAGETVATVGEAYEREVWADERIAAAGTRREPLPGFSKPASRRSRTRRARATSCAPSTASSQVPNIEQGDWPAALHGALSRNEIVFQLSDLLARPRPLHELPGRFE